MEGEVGCDVISPPIICSRLVFNICMIAYLYGDLAIYCTAVAKSLRDVSCPFTAANTSQPSTTEPCWRESGLSKADVYKIYVAVFLALLGPFAYFNLTKTKYLQILTSVMRWTAFITMICLSVLRISDTSVEHGTPPVMDISTTPLVFGVSVYAFMCHHSIPSLVTPVRKSSQIPAILGADYLLIATFYLVLCYTGIFAFPTVPDLYTLAFKPEESRGNLPLTIADYFLALFPVFTLSTNFPIISITLANNLQTIITDYVPPARNLPPRLRRALFPTVAILPPALVALATEDLGFLVSITGAYAGAGIQYFIPCSLVFLARKKLNHLRREFRTELKNPLESYFRHWGFIVMIVVWSALAVGLVTANFVLKAIK